MGGRRYRVVAQSVFLRGVVFMHARVCVGRTVVLRVTSRLG